MLYAVFSVCERLKITEQEFYSIPREKQILWLAYEEIRQAEEMEKFKIMIQALGAKIK